MNNNLKEKKLLVVELDISLEAYFVTFVKLCFYYCNCLNLNLNLRSALTEGHFFCAVGNVTAFYPRIPDVIIKIF